MCNLNDFGVNYLCQSLPFGGVKQSGFGRFAGVEGLRAECNLRAVTCDRVPWLAKTTIPPVLDYPVGREASWKFCESLGKFVYAQTLQDRLEGLIGVISKSLAGK